MNTLDSLLAGVRKFFSVLLNPSPRESPPTTPATPRASETPATISPRVLVINFDPVVDPARGLTLSQWGVQQRGWASVRELIDGYIADVDECSGGLVKYRVVERIDVDQIPIKSDGFTYTAANYLGVLNGTMRAHDPDAADYHAIVAQFNLLERVKNNEIDEVWMFGGPFFGFYESRMVGRGAFWCNSPPLENTDACPRRFVMMGFSYERGTGEMLEDLGHRAESLLSERFKRTSGEANLYQRFARYDKVAPGQAEVGLLHFAPNSERDYDWGNRRLVPSRCDDWFNFPNFQNVVRQVNCAEWGNGDIRLHHMWWFKHLPKVEGQMNGISNNWWSYVIQADNPEFDL